MTKGKHKKGGRHEEGDKRTGPSTVPCGNCGGTGKVLNLDKTGHGRHKYDKCIWCQGAGRVPE